MQLTRTFGPKARAKPTVQRVEAGLGARRRGARSASAAPPRCDETLMIEPAVALGHARADQRGQAEGALEVDVEHLVVELLASPRRGSVQRRHAGVVHQHVDRAELVVGRGRPARRTGPSRRRGRRRPVPAARRRRPRRPAPRTPRACGWRSPRRRRARAKARTISRPRPRLPPVTTATLPVRSKIESAGVVVTGSS